MPSSFLFRSSMFVCVSLALSACDPSNAQTKQLPQQSPEAAPSIQLRDRSEHAQAPVPPQTHAEDPTHSPVQVSRDGHSFIGTVAASAVVKVPAKQTGTLAELRATEGQLVKEGEILFRQDTTMAQLQLKQGEKALELAKIQAKAAQRELNRAQKLVSGGASTQVQLDGARTQAELATAGVAQAEAAIALARQQVRDGTMRAPTSGVITRKLMEKGELATMMPPSVIFVLETHDPIEVHVSVPIPALENIKAGQNATLHVRELGLRREAKVTRISDHVDPRTRSAQIIVQAKNEDRRLKPGMYVDVQLQSAPAR